jgi:hypothetical protein
MNITLSPQRRDDGPLTLSRQGDVLTINGTAYDFSQLPDGATLPREAVECQWLVSDVERIGGVLHLTLLLPHGGTAPEATRFPAPLTVTDNGPITLPPYEQ